ncbi:diaminopimelate epimerase [Candidatus Protochlamydia phocaeensis]|uniref:diaminopimelate epimerase n=1 Tax=Candidatus Protochlamydia phocaeensis TaxID=1414722 RepID=UPI0009ADBFFB|nr:diaminopimelate epimerase [Candidatus Protochlamydia phocaeensis]
MRWAFAKYTGCGNDFILFDNRQGRFPLSTPGLIQRLCHRQWGIGADGVILLESSSLAHARMRIFNADGSEAEMCGNGVRCLVHWMGSLGFSSPSYTIETMLRTLKAWRMGDQVRIEMGSPSRLQWHVPLRFESACLFVHHLDTGVPHAVLFVEDVDAVELNRLGPFIRHHSLWHPHGANVSIGQQIDHTLFKVRTFERGVEGETLACGTGATAVALAAAYLHHLVGPLSMQTRSGDCLQISFKLAGQRFKDVTMTGPAICTFEGEIDLPENDEQTACFSVASNSIDSIQL